MGVKDRGGGLPAGHEPLLGGTWALIWGWRSVDKILAWTRRSWGKIGKRKRRSSRCILHSEFQGVRSGGEFGPVGAAPRTYQLRGTHSPIKKNQRMFFVRSKGLTKRSFMTEKDLGSWVRIIHRGGGGKHKGKIGRDDALGSR